MAKGTTEKGNFSNDVKSVFGKTADALREKGAANPEPAKPVIPAVNSENTQKVEVKAPITPVAKTEPAAPAAKVEPAVKAKPQTAKEKADIAAQEEAQSILQTTEAK